MTETKTDTESVKALAWGLSAFPKTTDDATVATTLRTLAAERDRLRAELQASEALNARHLAEIRDLKLAMFDACTSIAERRNREEPGPIFAALNEALGIVEDCRFKAARAALKETSHDKS